MKSREELEKIANFIKKDIVTLTHYSGNKGAHLGGSLSIAEILAVLYGSILKYDVLNPGAPERDRFILSKAHAALGLYAALHYAGFLTDTEIRGAMHGDSPFYEHPHKSLPNGIEFSGGSLGQGLSLGVGTALGLKKKKVTGTRVYVVLGDGECNEGSVWEAASSGSHFQLDNLTIIVDVNGLQYDGKTTEIMNPLDMEMRWRSFGYDTYTVDGHDVMALQEIFTSKSQKPKAVIAHTIKGKGVSFAENIVDWHTGRLTDELYEQAMKELDACSR